MEEREREKGCGYERGNVRKRERERNHDGEDGGARLSARLDKELDRSPVILIRKHDAFDRVHRSLQAIS